MWIVAGFLFFWTFSPSIGIPLFYFQTDTLKFSQQFIGLLGSLTAGASIVGAVLYASLSRKVSLQRIIVASIGVGVVSTLAYLLYRDATSALIIDTLFGGVGMVTQLAFLDLAAKACPKHAEGTFFALLMSVYNLGTQGSQVTGGYLYDYIGYTPLVLISAAMTAAAWLLVPLVNIPEIERRARAIGWMTMHRRDRSRLRPRVSLYTVRVIARGPGPTPPHGRLVGGTRVGVGGNGPVDQMTGQREIPGRRRARVHARERVSRSSVSSHSAASSSAWATRARPTIGTPWPGISSSGSRIRMSRSDAAHSPA